MTDAIEEEELGDDESLDEHGKACCNDCSENDYIASADDIEDDVASAIEGFLEERHGCCGI